MEIFPELVQLEIAGHMLGQGHPNCNVRDLVSLLLGGPLPNDLYTAFLWPERYGEMKVADFDGCLVRAIRAENLRQIRWLGSPQRYSRFPPIPNIWLVLNTRTSFLTVPVLDAIAEVSRKPSPAWFFRRAVRNENLPAVTWANERYGIRPCDPNLYCDAIYNGDLEMCKWLRAHGCPLHKMAVNAAVYTRTNQLAILQWLVVDQGCEYRDMAYDRTEQRADVREFIRAHMLGRWVKRPGYRVALKKK